MSDYFPTNPVLVWLVVCGEKDEVQVTPCGVLILGKQEEPEHS